MVNQTLWYMYIIFTVHPHWSKQLCTIGFWSVQISEFIQISKIVGKTCKFSCLLTVNLCMCTCNTTIANELMASLSMKFQSIVWLSHLQWHLVSLHVYRRITKLVIKTWEQARQPCSVCHQRRLNCVTCHLLSQPQQCNHHAHYQSYYIRKKLNNDGVISVNVFELVSLL